MTFANRTLGFVNAPALMQRLIAGLQDEQVDVDYYRNLRAKLLKGLGDAGYEIVPPGGAFYMFPRSPLEDDVAFVRLLQEEGVLVVPGTGFGRKGYFRLSYAVDERVVDGAIPGFVKAMEKARSS